MLENKVAIITGGANGIGKATLEKFLKNGAKVAIIDVDPKGASVCQSFKEEGFHTEFYACNITDYTLTIDVFEKIHKDFGQIDILVNNAGITRDASLKKMTPEQWKQVIDVNLTGVFNCTKAVSPYMIEQGNGCIMNASSVVGLYGNFGQTNYAATKAGVIGMSKTWARELGRYNIRVNAVAPGFIQTEMIESVPEKVLDMMKAKSPLNRLGTVEDIANAYLYLASDMGSFVTGTTLSVDGGLIT
jgi:3-oxoacyl-[acyl-carrier protein] reductase